MTFYSIKYVETRGIDSFEGEIYKADFASEWHSSNGVALGISPRFESLGTTAFLTLEDATTAAKQKLQKAIKACDKKRNALELKLAKLG